MMTRSEHIEFCRRRALAYVDAGDIGQAIDSLLSDLGKHDETRPLQRPTFLFGMSADARDPAKVRAFIDGFN